MWVIQEVSLPNPNNVLIFCGKSYITWKHFIRGVLRFGEVSGNSIPNCMDVFIYLHGVLSLSRHHVAKHPLKHSEDKQSDAMTVRRATPLRIRRPLTLLMSKAAQKKCQDNRDRVFELHSVFTALPMPGRMEIPDPDYYKSYAQVLTDLEHWTSRNEPGGVTGIDTIQISCPQRYPTLSRTRLALIGAPFKSVSMQARRTLMAKWRHADVQDFRDPYWESLVDNNTLPVFIEEMRSFCFMRNWLIALLDIPFEGSKVFETRGSKALSQSCIERLWSFSEVG